MPEDRNIAKEFSEARRSFIEKKLTARPYNLDLRGDNKAIIELLDSFGIHPESNHLLQIKTLPGGTRDLTISNLELGYAIRDPSKPEGIKVMPDTLIVNINDYTQARFFLDLFRHICTGNIKYDHYQDSRHRKGAYRKGAYGAVGVQPTILTSSGEVTRPDLCVKYFNYAYPFSMERWKKSITVHDKIGEDWNLSGVTGIGNYIALRYLGAEGIPVPQVYLATSELLIQDYIDGYTVAEIKEHYDELKASGVLGDDDTIIDGIWDFVDKFEPRLTEAAKRTIEPIRKNWWSPDFQYYDINWGNIMIKRSGLQDPEHNYYVIDPLR